MPIEEDERPRDDAPFAHLQSTRRDFLRQASGVVGVLATASLLGLPSRAAAEPSVRAAGGLEGFIYDRMRIAHVPSVGAATVRGTRMNWAKGYGWANIEDDIRATPDTVYMLASISKTVICGALMQLWEAGSVDLDADVNTYLPFEVRNPGFPAAKITPRMLLTHTSSITDRYDVWGSLANPTPQGYCHGDAVIPLGTWLADYLVPGGAYYIASRNYSRRRPGGHYNYSNIGADVAAYIVEAVTATPFGQYCADHIFTPLAMADTGYHLADITTSNLAMPYRYRANAGLYTPLYQYGYPDYPCGALRTSARSLSRWLLCFMNFGELDGARILKRSTVKEIRRPQIAGNWWQGLIWYYQKAGGELQLGHNGGDYGVSTSMFFGPHTNTGAIALANRYVYNWKAWYALLDIQNRLFAAA